LLAPQGKAAAVPVESTSEAASAAVAPPPLPAPSYYLPAKNSLVYQDTARGGVATVRGAFEFARTHAFGRSGLKTTPANFPNAVVAPAVKSDLPIFKANNINVVVARFDKRAVETEEVYRTRIHSYMTTAQSLGIRVILSVEWHYDYMLLVRDPLIIGTRANVASQLDAGNYDVVYTYSGKRSDGTIGETRSSGGGGQVITLNSANRTNDSHREIVATVKGYESRDGGFLPWVAGWNIYVKAPNGYYVRQNDAPLQNRTRRIARVRTDGCSPSDNVLTRCMPPYNNTISPNEPRIKADVARFNKYTNLIGYWVIDEPSSVGASVPAMQKIYQTWKRYSGKPIIVNFAEILGKLGNDRPTGDRSMNNPFATGVCDICVMEMYTRKQLGPFGYAAQLDAMAKFKAEVRAKYGARTLPRIWAMPQGHTIDSPLPFKFLRVPRYSDVYRSTTDLVRSGAQGVVWYTWDKSVRTPNGKRAGGGIKHNVEALRAIKDFGARLKKRSVVTNAYTKSLWIQNGSRLEIPARGHISGAKGTVSFWVSPTWNGADGSTHTLFEWASASTSSRLSIEKTATNRLRWRLISSTGRKTLYSVPVYARPLLGQEPTIFKPAEYPDTMYHFVLTWGNGSFKLYLDDRLVGSVALTHTMGATPPNFYIGANRLGDLPAGGRYSDITVYLVPLTTEQVVRLNSATPADTRNLFAPKLAYPLSNWKVAGITNIRLRSNPDPSIRIVRLYVDGKFAAYAASFPYVVRWNTRNHSNGYHTIHVKYERYSGAVQAGPSRRIVVNN